MSNIIWPVKQMENDWFDSDDTKPAAAGAEIATKWTPKNGYEITISHMDRETFQELKSYLDNKFFTHP